MKIFWKSLACCVAGAALLAAPLAHAAEPYPTKPIKLIVPYPPGGGIDPAARMFAQALGEELGQPFVIQNTGGASGQIGTEQAAKAPADGYTLLFASAAPNAILPAVVPKLPYTNKDLAAITLVGGADYVLVGNPGLPAGNIQELLQLMKTSPGKVDSYASSGPLSGPHLAGELFNLLAGTHMNHIPYRGNGPAVMAVLSGEVPIGFASAPAVVQHIKDGKLRAFGVSGKKRSELLPDAPALAETMPGLEVSQWYGLMAPAGTPQDIIARINKASVKVLSSQKVRTQLAVHGVEAQPTSPAEFDRFIESETLKYKGLARKANLSAAE
jgi:tripartite-type tricarboxylate transporter receptor subunit TctC